MGSRTSLTSTAVNPAAVSTPVVTLGSASEKAAWVSPPGAVAAVVAGQCSPDRAGPLLAVVGLPHQLHQPRPRTQRPPDVGERRHRVGEEHRAEPAEPHGEVRSARIGWTWASASSKSTLGIPSSSLSRRARSSIGRDRSTPSALPAVADLAASRVVCPVPQPMSSTRSAVRTSCGRAQLRVVADSARRRSRTPQSPHPGHASSSPWKARSSRRRPARGARSGGARGR